MRSRRGLGRAKRRRASAHRKQLAGILLARRGDVGMADDIAAADRVALLDRGDQGDQRCDLLVGERAVTELMARVDDLDADAGRIDVGDVAPTRLAGVPGAVFLVDQRIGVAVFVDQIMGGDLGIRARSAG